MGGDRYLRRTRSIAPRGDWIGLVLERVVFGGDAPDFVEVGEVVSALPSVRLSKRLSFL
jgi:hypothetical protein